MAVNNGEKMPVYEGADGKLYYNFGLGLKVEMYGSDRNRNEEYTLEVVGCRYIGNTEYYDIARDGVPLPQPLSANRVKYLLSRYGVKTLASGVRRELPLLVEEVENYYSYRERVHIRAQQQASAVPEYVALETAARALNSQIGYAEAFGRKAEARALQDQQTELKRRASDVLIQHDIEPARLDELPKCEQCGGKGFDAAGVCACAIEQTDVIKQFCAAERCKLRKLAGN